MTKISDGVYKHRNVWITKLEQGIVVDNHLEIFKTYNDAKEFINKILDGSNKIEPRIIGEWHE
ncbi:hypothetical protein [Ruminococcus champanellensis]|jgi:hypothetical protein|uniref:Uncharacterized protein n=1 Tax=Ruminococcus champanellensis (strain DSM 18848 / JCM 17042 / KCTC 15320 / 18P13) TaxID=213810 RepID=D4LDX8_RUMC1|nr:hypothetical protein [Ruminococcus champanellensis]CBL17823.1 hypothetical protein RUM_17590 [Ruminococcus champanellensis 18P13 = JCM 17042]